MLILYCLIFCSNYSRVIPLNYGLNYRFLDMTFLETANFYIPPG